MTVAVITGASRGIGRAAALALSARGLDVALLARTSDALGALAIEIKARGGRALAVACDVASPVAVAQAAPLIIEQLGVPGVVVNNAGIVHRGRIDELSVEAWNEVIQVNLTSVFLVTRAFLPSMLAARQGRFVQVASISATLGTAGGSAYAASKWGMVGFTKSLAEELRSTPLCALSVLPGSVDTKMLQGSGFKAQISPEEVAGLIVYAALDAPSAMNGTSLEMFGR